MAALPVWHEDTIVSAYDTDFKDEWKPASMVLAMQTVGSRHANHLGFSVEALAADNHAWILARLKIRIFKTPRVDDVVRIRTFPKGIQQKIFFVRDAQFLDPNGQVVAAGSTAWVLIDLKTWKILPSMALNGRFPPFSGLVGLDEPLEKIPIPDGLEQSGSVRATYSMVDVMGHVNNARYVEWAVDCFTLDHYRAHRLDWLQINYTNDVKPGEQVDLYTGPKPDDPSVWLVHGENARSGKRSFEAALGFSPNHKSSEEI